MLSLDRAEVCHSFEEPGDIRQLRLSRCPKLPQKLELRLRRDDGSSTLSRMARATEVGAKISVGLLVASA